jgi:ferredoxin
MTRIDLARVRPVGALLRSRWPQFLITSAALGGFAIAIVAGLFGTPVGSRNFSIVVVWIAWWALLMLLAVPFLGRSWCSVCPIPAPGEWLQRGALLAPTGRGLGLGWRWPKRLRGIWLQNGAFVLLALFSAVVLTQPFVTALVLLALLIVATATGVIFERRAFCRYLCPVGGFIGLYSQLAPVELRVKDSAVCASHRVKTCYTGNADGYGCPWQVFPAGLVKNINCGLCFECVRTCPYDNIAFNIRPFGADLLQPRGRRLDEAFKGFIMLGSSLVYIAVMLGPWGALKSAAYAVGSFAWITYAAAFVLIVLVVMPGIFLAAVLVGRALGRSRVPARKAFVHMSYSLTPLGLAAWIAFSLSFVFSNISYVWPVLSDPLGRGWNVIGTAGVSWTPYLTRAVPFLQTIVVLAGLAWAAFAAQRIAGQLVEEEQAGHAATWQALPVVAFCTVVAAGLLILLV